MSQKRIVIIGGVAGGANAAVRARRLSETAEITIFERGPFVSFANCGLPYYIGGEIADRKKLTVHTPESLEARFAITVKVRHEVIEILTRSREVKVRDLCTDRVIVQPYDDLIIATGAAPAIPPLQGMNSPLLFTVRDIPDVDRIQEAMAKKAWQRVTVLGGGYIGLEMVEQLHRLGAHITLVQSLPQVMGQFDPEIAAVVHETLRAHNVELLLGDPLQGVETNDAASMITVITRSGRRIEGDAAILALGVRPETTLATKAGLALGPRGGIKVDAHLRTSVPNVWAVGDAIEVKDWISGIPSLIALAGPANRQGRMVANNIFGLEEKYDGTLGTAVIRVFDLTVACTGSSERALKARGSPYKAIHLHPNSHAGYYPGAHPLSLKLLYEPDSGRILGAQAVGVDGVEKRIDVIATAIKGGLSASDLAELELCYAPPFGSAKDPVNLAGMIAQNHLKGLVDSISWDAVPVDALLLDVRDSAEVEKGRILGSIHIPLNRLRAEMATLPRDREIVAYCQSGQRSYYACRILSQHGFQCRNLSGAYKTWSAAQR